MYPGNIQLSDKFGRVIKSLRISVTDRCNLRCIYCNPSGCVKSFPYESILSFEELHELIKIFVELGVEDIHITGGEPLLRKNLTTLIKQIASIKGINDIALTTNGTLLSEYIHQLEDSGLKRINIGLTTLDRNNFKKITEFDLLEHKIDKICTENQQEHKEIKEKIDTITLKIYNQHHQ